MDTRGNSGTLFMSAYTFKPRTNINSFREKTFTKSLGGAMAPLPPPPGYATGRDWSFSIGDYSWPVTPPQMAIDEYIAPTATAGWQGRPPTTLPTTLECRETVPQQARLSTFYEHLHQTEINGVTLARKL